MFPNSSLKGTRLEVRVFWEVFGQENVLPISTLQEDEGKIILARLQWEYLREGLQQIETSPQGLSQIKSVPENM